MEIALQGGEFYPNKVANFQSDSSERDDSEGGLLRYPVLASPYYNEAHCMLHDQEDIKGGI